MEKQFPGEEIKPPMCRLTMAAMVLLGFPVIFITLALLLSNVIDINVDQSIISLFLNVVGVLSLFSFFASTILGLSAIIRVKKSKTSLRGSVLAIFVVIFSTVIGLFVFSLPFQGRVGYISQRVVCGTNLKGLGTALYIYAHEYGGRLPGELWCDRLIEYGDVSPKSLVCPSSGLIEGECSYALNKHILNHKLSELPADMVILFEIKCSRDSEQKEPINHRESFSQFPKVQELMATKQPIVLKYWNQIAGPEALSTANHNYEGCNIVFADGHANYVTYNTLQTLRWSMEAPELSWFPEIISKKTIKNANKVTYWLPWFIFCGGMSVILFFIKKQRTVFCFLSILISSLVGLYMGSFLGNLVKIINVYLPESMILGYRAGLIWGSVAGLVYAIMLIKFFPSQESRRNYNLLIGVFIGIASALLIDVTLMAYYNCYDFWSLPMAFYGGIPIGAGTAAILNRLFDVVVKIPNPTR